THTVTEEVESGGTFTTTFGGDCASDGTVQLAEGEDLTCVVTNTLVEAPTTLTVVKECQGDFVGTGPDFTFLLDGSPVEGLTATCMAGSATINVVPGVDFELTEDLDLPDGWSFEGTDCNVDVDEIDGGVELNI